MALLDYLLPGCSPGSSEASLLSPRVDLQTQKSAQQAPTKLSLRPELSSSEVHDGLSLCHSNSTASIAEEARSPKRRGHSRTGWDAGGSGGSSDEEDDGGSDGHGCQVLPAQDSRSRRSSAQHQQAELKEQAHNAFAGPAGRYSNAPPSPPGSQAEADQTTVLHCNHEAESPALSADHDSPDKPSYNDSFTTPPAALLYGSRSSRECSSGSRGTSASGSAPPGQAGTPAVWRGTSPQQQLEVLEAKLAAEVEARWALQRRLAEQRSEAEAQQQALGRDFEGRLAALRLELEHAAQAAAGGAQLTSSGQGTQQELELLVKAYQAENELAVARMRRQAADHQRHAAEAAQQLAELQQALAAAQAERARQPPATPAVDAARLQEVLRLQGELQGVQAAACQREAELEEQVKGLQAKLAQALKEADTVTPVCEQQRHAWLRMQQQLADSDTLVQQQAQVILQLEQRLLNAPSSSEAVAGMHALNTAHTLQQLQAENTALHLALQQAQSQLAQQAQQECAASRAGAGAIDTQQQQQAVELQAKLSRLQATLARKEEQHQRQLRQLRHEHERLRVHQGIRAASKAGATRVRELELQLAAEREASARRLRVMESRLREAEAGMMKAQAVTMRSPTAPAAAPAPAASKTAGKQAAQERKVGKVAAAQHQALLAATTQLQQKEQRVRRLESELARREAEVAALQQRADSADVQANAVAEREAAAQEEVASLRQAVEEVMAANEGLQAQVRDVAVLKQKLAAQGQEVAELRQQGQRLQETEAVLAALKQAQAEQQASAEAEQRRLQQQHAGLAEQAQQAGREAAAAEWRARVQASQAEAARWHAQANRLEADLHGARAGLPWVPKAADFAALERRMLEVEAAARRRDAQWQGLAEGAARAAAQQQVELRQRFEDSLADKDRQVGEFRQQLDSLLAAARLLHVAGSS